MTMYLQYSRLYVRLVGVRLACLLTRPFRRLAGLVPALGIRGRLLHRLGVIPRCSCFGDVQGHMALPPGGYLLRF